MAELGDGTVRPLRRRSEGGLGMTEELPEAPARPALTPDLIVQLATSFMAIRYLITAVEVGVFGALGDAALDLDALAC
jgi:hypothetical protein